MQQAAPLMQQAALSGLPVLALAVPGMQQAAEQAAARSRQRRSVMAASVVAASVVLAAATAAAGGRAAVSCGPDGQLFGTGAGYMEAGECASNGEGRAIRPEDPIRR